MNFGSLFAGIGGMDLGLERAGMVCKWQVEIDSYCRRVLEEHWPGVMRHGDVRGVGRAELEPVHLICGGFPCQPVSTAGERKGTADTRWLWPEFHRIIRELRPQWVLVENVRGLLSIDAGRVFGGILRDLAESGYDAKWDCIPAAAVGAPHRRDRVFIVAHAQCVRELQPQGCKQDERRWAGDSSEAIPDAVGPRCQDTQGQCASTWASGRPELGASDWWDVEPDVGRVADGVPARVDRLRGLGNAVVPQVAEWIGRRIMMVQNNRTMGENHE